MKTCSTYITANLNVRGGGRLFFPEGEGSQEVMDCIVYFHTLVMLVHPLKERRVDYTRSMNKENTLS